ncbi:hypothetical protein [Methylobrevis albus]|uniref:Uncharacterized protein n=1 Tax=Methylobrevis albus TaxID=2793297 RepID=A0A931I3Y7_9HYPH|nr:hypothetical protein [Methylobrevis albus]MBH0238999.1 hypothetical protein [Methylobrevis albus]
MTALQDLIVANLSQNGRADNFRRRSESVVRSTGSVPGEFLGDAVD